MRNRFFFWGPQFISWPIKFMKGSDEYGWHTFGVVTWLGSVFYRYEKCTCPDVINSYSDLLANHKYQSDSF